MNFGRKMNCGDSYIYIYIGNAIVLFLFIGLLFFFPRYASYIILIVLSYTISIISFGVIFLWDYIMLGEVLLSPTISFSLEIRERKLESDMFKEGLYAGL